MNHEKLYCYQGLLEIAPHLMKTLKKLPLGYSYLAAQLKRALSSSILNLAEGNAKISQKERRRFFLTSRASIAEICAVLDIFVIFNFLSLSEACKYKLKLGKLYAMISNL